MLLNRLVHNDAAWGICLRMVYVSTLHLSAMPSRLGSMLACISGVWDCRLVAIQGPAFACMCSRQALSALVVFVASSSLQPHSTGVQLPDAG